MFPQSRREFLTQTGGGFASVALSALLADELRAASPKNQPVDPLQPLAERLPHLAPKAKQVIFLCQYGGPSTFDLLDYKPELLKLNGQPVPHGPVILVDDMVDSRWTLTVSAWLLRQAGSGEVWPMALSQTGHDE